MFEKIENNRFLYITNRLLSSGYQITNYQRKKLLKFYLSRQVFMSIYLQITLLPIAIFQKTGDPKGVFAFILGIFIIYIYSMLRIHYLVGQSKKIPRQRESLLALCKLISASRSIKNLLINLFGCLFMIGWSIWKFYTYSGQEQIIAYFCLAFILCIGAEQAIKTILFLLVKKA